MTGALPAHAYTRGALCPSCERFIGPVDVCPFCEADSARRPLLRRLCRAVPAAAIALLAILYGVAVRRDPHAVAIRGIRPTMNFAVVKLSGVVAAAPRVRESRGQTSLMFRLDDGTGRILVVLDPAAAQQLVRQNRVIRRGDRLVAEGVLRCQASGAPLLRVSSARQIRQSPSDSLGDGRLAGGPEEGRRGSGT